MRGKYDITVENAFIRYEFTIQRNITVIRGQSATGKTTLVEMIREYNELPDTGINIRCDKTLAVLYGRDWQDRLANISDSIVFIDEQSRFVKTHEFAEAVKGSNNYFVIVTREKLSELPYSVTEIYGIRTRGKYAGLVGEYTANEFYRIYADIPTRPFEPDVIITEDSNSGFDFWNTVTNSCECIPAGGKSNIIKCLKEDAKENKKYLAIVDGAAFGAELEEMIQYIKYRNQNVEIYAPESFEYILLTSGLFKSNDINDKCNNTYDYADSVKYMSWEQFYSELLTAITKDTELQYSKHKLNVYYLSERNMELVVNSLPDRLKIRS